LLDGVAKEVIQVFRKISKRAQTTAEYAILIAIVVGAVVAMQIYVRRGIQGRVRNIVDDSSLGGTTVAGPNGETATAIFDPDATGSVGQYEPYYAATDVQSRSGRSQQEVTGQDAEVGRGTAEIARQRRQQVNAWVGGTEAVAPDAIRSDALADVTNDEVTQTREDNAATPTIQEVHHTAE